MGQLASRAFDGDPYIDIMRALPDKEMSWWVQKVIYIAEGYTFLEHVSRTYPKILMHKCHHCNGAGTVTCTHCHGYKVKRAHSHAFRLSEQTSIGRLLAKADTKECEHCGTYCPWDDESEWQEKWDDWQSKLSYYDQAHAPLMNEWYEEVINEGRLEQDTEPEEEPMPPPDDNSLDAQASRTVAKYPQRLKALLKRSGGHPYQTGDLLPYQLLNPFKPLSENIKALGHTELYYPPEINPRIFPGMTLSDDSPLSKFHNEIEGEHLIMQNLDAALQDLPKPVRFGETAGTTTCPECQGVAWGYSWAPNLGTLLRAETPFWQRTLSRMTPNWFQYASDDTMPTYSPYLSKASGAEGVVQVAAGSKGRLLGEVPIHPPIMDEQTQQAVEVEMAADRRARAAKLQAGWGSLSGDAKLHLAQRIADAEDLGGSTWRSRSLPTDKEAEAASASLWDAAHPLRAGYGEMDPLAQDPVEALDSDDLQQMLSKSVPQGPLLKGNSGVRALKAANLANPARHAARAVRDARQLAKAENTEEQELLRTWAMTRPALNSKA